MTSEVRQGRTDPGGLRASALAAVVVGAVGSMALLFHGGEHHPPVLMVLFVFWVLSPFVALAWAHARSQRWAPLTRTTLYGVMLLVTLGSLAIYGDDARGHRRAQAAFVWVVVPPASWALAALAIPITALISRRRSLEEAGAS